MGESEWYKEMFITKVMTRSDYSPQHWKEQYIDGLPSFKEFITLLSKIMAIIFHGMILRTNNNKSYSREEPGNLQ